MILSKISCMQILFALVYQCSIDLFILYSTSLLNFVWNRDILSTIYDGATNRIKGETNFCLHLNTEQKNNTIYLFCYTGARLYIFLNVRRSAAVSMIRPAKYWFLTKIEAMEVHEPEYIFIADIHFDMIFFVISTFLQHQVVYLCLPKATIGFHLSLSQFTQNSSLTISTSPIKRFGNCRIRQWR